MMIRSNAEKRKAVLWKNLGEASWEMFAFVTMD